MPLDPSHRADYQKVPPLDRSTIPSQLRRGTGPPSMSLSYNHFEFDRSTDKLGRGGNAVVYKATILRKDLTVALKQPFPGKTVTNETFEQILSEANKWTKVDGHPYIANVVDWGVDAYPWIAIEYLDGGTLIEKRSEMALSQRLWTAYAIADAVAYASGQHGITHHDIKPQNILFKQMPSGMWDVPKVCDWGIARELLTHDGSNNQATQRYAAPEQNSKILPDTDVGVQTDVYQLGVVCYELLTSEYPDHLTGNVSPPSTIDSSLPPSLDEVILKALAHDPTERFDHPIQFRDAFVDILSEPNNTHSRSTSSVTKSTSEGPSSKDNNPVNDDDVITLHGPDTTVGKIGSFIAREQKLREQSTDIDPHNTNELNKKSSDQKSKPEYKELGILARIGLLTFESSKTFLILSSLIVWILTYIFTIGFTVAYVGGVTISTICILYLISNDSTFEWLLK